MLVHKSQTISFIPQKIPMVMVDNLVSNSEVTSVTDFLVTKKNIFVQDGKFQEAGLIENIAQTAALRAGYLAQTAGAPVKKGFIGAVKKLKIEALPQIGDTLTTTIKELNIVMSASIISGQIEVNGKMTAQCEMTIFTEE